MLKSKIAKASLILRDPRDIAVSAFDHGQKIRESGAKHTFAKLNTLDEAILYTENALRMAERWMQLDSVLCVKYEDLLETPSTTLAELADFLDVSLSTAQIEMILDRYRARTLDSYQQNILHFNKGVVGRFRATMNREQITQCNQIFGSFLNRAGYAI